ncbi:hypothetical protein DMN91_003266 [Ooceraea biroi]|uniref:NADH dehydrogenase [ubiquinone] 1 alpha subcomplex subunit n=1 Tax=Ooceraea biroi TaxID=2015173 RepID=A0A026VXA0_OOCBI|nr:cytochrome c oxidase subunit NDUFA4 [Ooceraea biroi]EZA48285.1 NADH dehydrogenase [ubiquinone] 1 alpha subcomplex subunit [Ooceraea biroi]RLU25174.1 hypothetical protein DMN91_003266 [Ooceraea biroi]
MQGLNLSSLKKNPALVPLYFCMGLGGAAAALYLLRLALRSPDVSWRNKKEAEPWNDYKDKQYKFYTTKSWDENAPKTKPPEY